jgi:hypothetical protein
MHFKDILISAGACFPSLQGCSEFRRVPEHMELHYYVNVLCGLADIYIYCFILWSGGQSSWLLNGNDCVSCEVQAEFIYFMKKKVDRLCGLVVRVRGYTTEMYCVSCEVRTELICYVEESIPPLWSRGQSSWLHNGDVLCFL